MMCSVDLHDAHSSDLHLTALQRVVISSPRMPLHAVGVRLVRTTQVEAVEVGSVTTLVPPTSLVRLGTRRRLVNVVVLVERTKFHILVRQK